MAGRKAIRRFERPAEIARHSLEPEDDLNRRLPTYGDWEPIRAARVPGSGAHTAWWASGQLKEGDEIIYIRPEYDAKRKDKVRMDGTVYYLNRVRDFRKIAKQWGGFLLAIATYEQGDES